MPQAPHLDFDPYSEQSIVDPFAAYCEMRDLAPVVQIAHGFLAIGRFDNVKAALVDWETFSSASGTGMNTKMNDALKGSPLASDPPHHNKVREILMRPFAPRRLKDMRTQISAMADGLIARLCEEDSFDAATDLAQFLPVNIVSHMVGLPAEGREKMIEWGAAFFDAAIPDHLPKPQAAQPLINEALSYIGDPDLPNKVAPGSWAAELHQSVEAGEIDKSYWPPIVSGYVFPAIDTTAFATSNLLWLLANHPDQWELLRKEPGLVHRAINESMRLEGPVQHFSRLTMRDTSIGGIDIAAGTRVLLFNAAANRDDRRYADPDVFDITRDSNDQLAFGFSRHMCAGMNIAKMEMTALMECIIRNVRHIEILDTQRSNNPQLRGFEKLHMRFHKTQ